MFASGRKASSINGQNARMRTRSASIQSDRSLVNGDPGLTVEAGTKMNMNAHSEPGIENANYFRPYVIVILLAVFALSGCGSDEPGLTERGVSTAYDASGTKLGSVRFDNSCIDDAQPLLVRGLALLHHMTYEEAREAFSSAAEIDSGCAIAYWGSAMTYVHPLWPDTILSDSQIAGQALLDQARNATHSSTREVAYIDTLEAYYRTEGAERDRLAAFLDGWTRIRDAYPNDVEGELFYALALMATASASDKTYALQREAGAIAEAVKAEIPDHPGAHHYISTS